jgi:hypothetical protein
MPAGRQRWSTRRIVEDCLAFDVAKLARYGFFRTQSGALSYISWQNPGEKETLQARCVWETNANGKVLLHISFGLYENGKIIGNSRSQTIEIVHAKLHFGDRPYFLCPGRREGAPCRNRARIVYLASNQTHFACRQCLNLIHRSAREHDKRMDSFLRLHPGELDLMLKCGTIRQRMLAIRASVVLLQRLRKRAAKHAGRLGANQPRSGI